MRVITALLSGLVFGFGLILSEMINPEKVLAFLDIFGQWDPSLAFVMGAALIVAGLGYKMVFRRKKPFFADQFHLPQKQDIDKRLVTGSALFGIGWGIAGLCPGPAIVGLTIGGPDILIFLAAMLAGMGLFRILPTDR